MLGNTAVKIVHRQDVPASAHAVAQMTGTERVWEETRHFGGRAACCRAEPAARSTASASLPDTIASLPTGSAVVITKVPRAEVRVVQVAPAPCPGGSTGPAPPPVLPAVRPVRPARSRPAPARSSTRARPPERRGPEPADGSDT